MAHPYAGHKQKHVEKRRVKVLMRSGGYAHDDAAADKKLFKRMMHEHEHGKHGGEYANGGRIDKFARGGPAKLTPSKHKPHVSVNIVHHHSRPAALPLGGPGLGAGAPPVLRPGAGLPPPGGGMPGMKRGGRYISGISSGENLKGWKDYASKNTMITRAQGGRIESLASLPGGGSANQLADIPPSPGGSKPGAHSDPHLNSSRRAWADRIGGTERTRQPGKVHSGKRYGAGTGPSSIEIASKQKSEYP